MIRQWPLRMRMGGYQDAYTLIEVMVALIIMGVSITAVTGALSAAKGISGRADHAVEAMRVMRNILTNPPLLREIVSKETFEGTIEGDDEWSCKATSTPLVVNRSDLILPMTDERSAHGVKEEGEEIEVTGMVQVSICVAHRHFFSEKSYCIERWVPEPAQ